MNGVFQRLIVLALQEHDQKLQVEVIRKIESVVIIILKVTNSKLKIQR